MWDGDQVLYEIRSEGKTLSGALNQYGGGTGDHYGRVGYIHGPGLDQTLAVMRVGRSTAHPVIVPHTNWRGQYYGATRLDGWECDPASCGEIDWPAPRLRSFLDSNPSDPGIWMGSLVMDQADASGLLYRRNRYYDPATGRFTQEDPIGLAGGLNLYGFAGGDPVNFSDPFGLCPVPPGSCVIERAEAVRDAAVNVLLGAAEFIGEASGIAGAMRFFSGRNLRTNQRLSVGERGMEGGLLAASMIPNVPGGHGARVASRLVRSDGSLSVSRTVATQLTGERNFIPSLAIVETVRGGTRVADPQGAAGHFMYTASVEWTIGTRTSRGTLDVLVDEGRNVINHVLYRSK